MPVVDQHHGRQVVIGKEILKWVLHTNKEKCNTSYYSNQLTFVTHLRGLVWSDWRLSPKKPIARFYGTPIMKNLLFDATITLQMSWPAYAWPSSPNSIGLTSAWFWMYRERSLPPDVIKKASFSSILFRGTIYVMATSSSPAWNGTP